MIMIMSSSRDCFPKILMEKTLLERKETIFSQKKSRGENNLLLILAQHVKYHLASVQKKACLTAFLTYKFVL